jgi:hypothetical protein
VELPRMAKFNAEPLTALRSSRVRKTTLATSEYEAAAIATAPRAPARSLRHRTRPTSARTGVTVIRFFA